MATIENQKSKIKNQKSFSLVELLVAVTIFSFVSSISAGIFISGLRAQKKFLAVQELSDQMSFLMEYMSRSIRMAKKDDLDGVNCLSGDKVNYEITHSGQGIKLRNYKNVCQEFYLDGNILKENKAGTIYDLTSSYFQVLNFNVALFGQTQQDSLQPKATLFLEIKGREGVKIASQTSISQRNPDVEK